MGRNAVGQREKGIEPFPFRLAVRLHRHPFIGPADDRAQGNRQNIEELMALGMVNAGIGERREMLRDCGTG